jgi:NCS1 family nucleobase:cation symporter-1
MSFFCSFVVYLAICTVWPTKNQKIVKEMGLKWEEQSGEAIIAEDGTEIVEEGKFVRERDGNSYGDGVFRETYGVEKTY